MQLVTSKSGQSEKQVKPAQLSLATISKIT